MDIYQIYFTYGDHEMENELFASKTGDTVDARAYLLKMYGGESEYMSEPDRLKIDGVHPFSTINASNGDPYKVVLAGEVSNV